MVTSEAKAFSKLSRLGRRARVYSLILLVSGILFIVAGEICLRQFYPQVVMFPRWGFVEAYGPMLSPDVRMLHERPGQWRFAYTINAERCRGNLIDAAAAREKHTVVVLGDSYSMGMGVDDGEEYPAIMQRALGDGYSVINTGNPGWGIAQQVRRYIEYGEQFEPDTVVLQFCANDPEDTQANPVATWDGDKFVFSDTPSRPNALFRFLARYEFVQKSQVYALLRNVYETRRDLGRAHAAEDPEEIYVAVLEPFARYLSEKQCRLIVIDVNGQFAERKTVHEAVKRLHAEGLLEYVDLAPAIKEAGAGPSPEGHVWGKDAHRVVGEKVAGKLLAAD